MLMQVQFDGNTPAGIWHILFSLAMIIVIALSGFSFKVLNTSLTEIKEYQKLNDSRHMEFVGGLLALIIELHPEKAEITVRSFKGLLK